MASKKDKVKDSERFSIISPLNGHCYFCGSTDRVAIHEIFYGSNGNRSKSKEYGLTVHLCWSHHNGSNMGVHYNKDLDLKLKKQAEKIWIKTYTSDNLSIDDKIKAFIKVFKKNYLDDSDLPELIPDIQD